MFEQEKELMLRKSEGSGKGSDACTINSWIRDKEIE